MSTSELQLEPIGSLSGELVRFGLVTGIGLALGWIVYRLLTDPGSRRAQFQHLGTLSRRASIAIGLTLAMVFATSAYRDSFLAFTAIGWSEDALVLERRFPRRRETLELSQVTAVGVVRERGGPRLVIRTDDGRAPRSTPTSLRRAEHLRDEIRSRMRRDR